MYLRKSVIPPPQPMEPRLQTQPQPPGAQNAWLPPRNIRRAESAPQMITYSIFDSETGANFKPALSMPQKVRTSDANRKANKSSLVSSPRTSKNEGSSLIKNIVTWTFDLFNYMDLYGERTFENVCITILRTFGVDTTLAVQEHTLRAWLKLVEFAYEKENPYHNAIHAADVTQATACFIRCPRVRELLDSYDIAACLISAIVHDVHHPGMVNAALERMGHPLSFAFKAPYLERHHVDIAFDLTENNSEANIFRNLNPTQRRWFKKEITELVFATDMSQHVAFHGELKKMILDNNSTPGTTTVDVRRLKTTRNILTVKKMILKAADVSNTQRPLNVYVSWAERICEEFFRQADTEMSRGMPPTLPDFVREVCSVPKTQLAFLDFLRPFVDTVSSFLELPELILNLKINYQFCQDLFKQGVHTLEQVKLASKNGVVESRSRGEPWETQI